MYRALFMDTVREIKKSRSRFLSIMLIILLGVAFFVGIKSTGLDMKLTADRYFDEYNLMDIHLLSTVGFNSDDIKAVKGTQGVLGVMPSYSMDGIANIDNRDMVVKIIALPSQKTGKYDEAYINRPKLLEGRYPKKSGECVIEKSKMLNEDINMGDRILLSSGTDKEISDSLKTKQYIITGVVESPYYISYDRGTAAIGTGKVNSYILIPQSDFKMDYYNSMFVTVKGAREKYCYNNSYDKTIMLTINRLKKTGTSRINARYDEIKNAAIKKLNKSKDELSLQENKQNKALEKAKEKIDQSLISIKKGEMELQNKEKVFKTSEKIAEQRLVAGNKQFEAAQKGYDTKLSTFEKTKPEVLHQLLLSEQKLQAGELKINEKENELNKLKLSIQNNKLDPIMVYALMLQLKSGSEQLKQAQNQLGTNKKQLEANKKKFEAIQLAFKNNKQSLDKARSDIIKKKENLQKTSISVVAQLKSGKRAITASKAQLEKARIEYEKSKDKLSRVFKAADNRIMANEKALGKFNKPLWYVLDRNTNPGFVDYESAADRMDAIARVFPVFFFLIAALVCMTTMTRMVDDERGYIGTLKALGYSKLATASKYLIYSILASSIGSILGVFGGYKLFPTVISNAYGLMYTVPKIMTPLNPYYIFIAVSLSIAITVLAAVSSCYRELMITPADLMRPKAPKPGKRIFLENIRLIWNRLSFTHKVTARNMFRYKKRLSMTVLGIAGCTALMVAGFGLKDSIVSIVSKQFNELYKYNMTIDLNKEIQKGKSNLLIREISKDNRIKEYLLTSQRNIEVDSSSLEKSATLFVPENDKLKDFIILRARTTGKEVTLCDDGVILTEKLSKMLKVNIGDKIVLKDGDTNKFIVKVSGITENYVYHYIYMTGNLYEKLYHKKPTFMQLITKNSSTSEAFENKLSTDLLRNPEAKAVSFTTGISKKFKDIVTSLNYIVLILIVSAGLLAFIVLYNLTNVNISERVREIATIKVLGFYDKEVSAYIFRENIVLTIIGLLIGLVIGIFLHRFTVVTAEVDYVMFGRNIEHISFLYAALLTIVFSVLVNYVMYFKLKKVDMVQSLKSVD